MKNIYEMSGASKVRETGENEIVYRTYDNMLFKQVFISFGNMIMEKANLKAGDRVAIGFDEITDTLVISKSVQGFKIGKKSRLSSAIAFALKDKMGLPERKIIFSDPLITNDKTIILKIE